MGKVIAFRPRGPTNADFYKALAFTAVMYVPGVIYCIGLEIAWQLRKHGCAQ